MMTTDIARPTTKIGTNESTPVTAANSLPIFDDTIRAKFISLICNATYDDVGTELAASCFIEKCLELCGGSEELLAQTLQTKFVDGRTPIFWVVCHLKWLTNDSNQLPPIIRRLLERCGPVVPSIIDDDVDLACCARSDSKLYHFVRQYRHGAGVGSAPFATVTYVKGDYLKFTDWTFGFPQFLDQMLIAGSVEASWISYYEFLNPA